MSLGGVRLTEWADVSGNSEMSESQATQYSKL